MNLNWEQKGDDLHTGSAGRLFPKVSASKRRSVAGNIPLDIFVDNISPYLHVEDIMALRRVNKHYFHLTHEPLIWKRFLQELEIPLPPIRPTLDYSVQRSDYEFEQLVSRAISLQNDWYKTRPAVVSTVSLKENCKVLDMKLLPGGKYLVAFIGDDHRFFITLYHLDHPSGPHALARCQVQSEAYQLQAEYMKYENKPVIMIAYISRLRNKGGSSKIDPAKSGNNANVGSSASVSHVLECINVDLSTLDLLADVYRKPADPETTKHKLWSSVAQYKPFTPRVRLPLDAPSEQLSLFSRNGIAFASVLQRGEGRNRQDYLVIVEIQRPCAASILVFNPFACPLRRQVNRRQWVKAVCHLPKQNSVLIWRTIRNGCVNRVETFVHAIELVKMPDASREGQTLFRSPLFSNLVLDEGTVTSVCMTNEFLSDDIGSNVPHRDSSRPPPPISVFAETSDPQGIFHWHIWPKAGATPEDPPFVYEASAGVITKQTVYITRPYAAHVLPGVSRSLIYTVDSRSRRTAAPSLISLYRYVSPEYQSPRYTIPRIERRSTVERREYPGIPFNVHALIDVGQEALARYHREGLGAMAWDPTIGRVCLTTGSREGRRTIEILDFSHVAPVDERFPEWKSNHPEGFERDVQDENENEFVVLRRARPKR